MVNTTLTALFEAKETISSALEKAEQATSSFDNDIQGLQTTLTQVGAVTDGAESEINNLRDASIQLGQATEQLDDRLEAVNRSMVSVSEASDVTDIDIAELERSMRSLSATETMVEEASDQLGNEFRNLAANSNVSNRSLSFLDNKISEIMSSSVMATGSVERLTEAMQSNSRSNMRAAFNAERYDNIQEQVARGAIAGSAAQQIFSSSLNDTSGEMRQASMRARTLTGDLSILNAAAGSTAFQFSSLSVNIGPFNLALRNIVTQLPAILTGMSTILALVTSLITAFATLGLVTGGLILGGALAFFEDFSGQFEDSAKAAEALMGALRDLFTNAMQPVMTEANMDLFISSINAAADVVNRFAQFFNQMRVDVLGFFSTVDGDIDDFFESMHDTFILLQPILRGFIEFFITDIPILIKRFALLTDSISGDIGLIISSIGGLINQLLDFASVVISIIAPTIFVITGALETIFFLFNLLPDFIETGVVAFAVLGFIVSSLIVKFANMAASMATVHGQLVSQAAAGSVLSSTYGALSANLSRYIAGQISLRMALSATLLTLKENIAAWAANTSAKLLNISTTNTLIVAMARQLSAISALTAGNISLSTAMKLTAANAKFVAASIWSSITAMLASIPALLSSAAAFVTESVAAGAAAGATWLFNAAVAALTSPIWLVVVAVAALFSGLVALAQMLTEQNIFAPLIDGAQFVIDKLHEMIGLLDVIPGIGGKEDILGPAGARDIQTNPNVDLSFEDSLEQNVDVQADPEDKAQIKRLTKDALEEANSFGRSQQGV